MPIVFAPLDLSAPSPLASAARNDLGVAFAATATTTRRAAIPAGWYAYRTLPFFKVRSPSLTALPMRPASGAASAGSGRSPITRTSASTSISASPEGTAV